MTSVGLARSGGARSSLFQAVATAGPLTQALVERRISGEGWRGER